VRLLTSKRYDRAVIEVLLPDASGIALAAVMANENTPALLISGSPRATARLKQFDLTKFPCLKKPIDFVQVRTETDRVMADCRQNLQQIKDGIARWTPASWHSRMFWQTPDSCWTSAASFVAKAISPGATEARRCHIPGISMICNRSLATCFKASDDSIKNFLPGCSGQATD
jgi:hypothetical protein